MLLILVLIGLLNAQPLIETYNGRNCHARGYTYCLEWMEYTRGVCIDHSQNETRMTMRQRANLNNQFCTNTSDFQNNIIKDFTYRASSQNCPNTVEEMNIEIKDTV